MVFGRAFLATACILLAAGTAAAAQSQPDVQAIHRLASQFERAWNTQDMTLLGDMVTDDVDFVNVVGFHWIGRQQGVDNPAACALMNLQVLPTWSGETYAPPGSEATFGMRLLWEFFLHVKWGRRCP